MYGLKLFDGRGANLREAKNDLAGKALLYVEQPF